MVIEDLDESSAGCTAWSTSSKPSALVHEITFTKNEISKLLTPAAKNVGLQRKEAKVANRSVRKTSIGRLLDANTPETIVAYLSRQKILQSLQSYKSAKDHHQRQMSYILSRVNKIPYCLLKALQVSVVKFLLFQRLFSNRTANSKTHITSMKVI